MMEIPNNVVYDMPRKKNFLNVLFSGKFKYIIIVLILCIVGISVYFYYIKINKNIQTENKAEVITKNLIQAVSKHMILPEEEPAVFMIQDPDVLISQQAFFNGAEKGDNLLIYRQAGKAIIYSPKRDVIVNVGPVNFDQNANSNQIQPLSEVNKSAEGN